jgi:2-polyprenyl-3-methyl-5-hydroxy-6-metoxy-1,4-benzoquinol methylase
MITSAGGQGLNILDIGCGPAFISQHIYEMGNCVTCADLPDITALAHKHRDLLVVATDAECTAFADESFDVIIATEILEHLWYPEKFLTEVHRILVPNGYVIIEVPEGKEGLRWDAHCQYFTLESLEKLVQDCKFSVFKWERLKPNVGVPTPSLVMMIQEK